MELKIPYGEVDLKKIREEGYLYIDKTMYIEKLEKNSKLIYTRPRRFGKSMLTSMLAYYYSINEAENFEKIFKGLYTLQTLGFPPENLVDGNLAATGSKIENMAGLITREENYFIMDI